MPPQTVDLVGCAASNFADAAYSLSLSLGMLLLFEVGRRIGLRRRAKAAEGAVAGSGVIEGAVFALFGLLVAFTFSGAAARFDTRRQLIVEETNAIGTAYLRLDLLPADVQPTLRERFRQYLAARLEAIASCRTWQQRKRHWRGRYNCRGRSGPGPSRSLVGRRRILMPLCYCSPR
jgi:hypothetical protein